jgi:TRAP-type C4-dicarboxylate transport system substrate-binding protein
MKARLLLTSLLVGAGGLLFAQAGNAAPITIKFAHNSPVRMDAGFHRYFVNFSKLAVKYTNGKVKFQEFPASQMGSDAVAAKKLQLGLIQMMDLASNNLVKFYGGFDLFTLPFLIPSLKCGVDHVMTDPKLLHEISEGAQKKANIRVLAFETGGQRNMMNSKHAIMSPADLKGLRYSKVCILADADSDGAHIATLLCALFLKHFRSLVEQGHIYVAMPPLYRIDIGKEG